MYKHEILNAIKSKNVLINTSFEGEKAPLFGLFGLVNASIEFHIDENFDKVGASDSLTIHKKIEITEFLPFDIMLITTDGEDFWVLEKKIINGRYSDYISVSIMICKYITDRRLYPSSTIVVEFFGMQYLSDKIATDDHVWKDIASCHDDPGCIGVVYDRSVESEASISIDDHFHINTRLSNPYNWQQLGLSDECCWVDAPTVLLFLAPYLPMLNHRDVLCDMKIKRSFTLWKGEEFVSNFVYKESMRSLHIITSLLLMCSCKNIEYVDTEHQTTKKERNAYRLRGLFAPISYKSVRINPHAMHKYTNGCGIPGTLGSVPLHLCRGHFAEYTEERKLFGKYVGRYWIPPHVRGNPELGTVEKDYEVKHEIQQSQ